MSRYANESDRGYHSMSWYANESDRGYHSMSWYAMRVIEDTSSVPVC